VLTLILIKPIANDTLSRHDGNLGGILVILDIRLQIWRFAISLFITYKYLTVFSGSTYTSCRLKLGRTNAINRCLRRALLLVGGRRMDYVMICSEV
jgi:hypothetical protein